MAKFTVYAGVDNTVLSSFIINIDNKNYNLLVTDININITLCYIIYNIFNLSSWTVSLIKYFYIVITIDI